MKKRAVKVTDKLWKKMLSVILSVIIAFGTAVTIIVGSSRLQDMLGIQSMLSAYASQIVDTTYAAAVDEESMLANHNVIDLENKDGSNTLYLFSEAISYTDENGRLKTKDISVEKQSNKEMLEQGYEYANGQNDYRINFSKNSERGVKVEFGGCGYSIKPNSIINVQGRKASAVFLNEEFENFEYENLYGDGTKLRFYPQLNGVKDEIVLESDIGENVFSFIVETENCSAVLNDDGTVSLISDDDESVVQTFSAPYAYDSEYIEGYADEHYSPCEYSLEKTAENTYRLEINTDKAWLEDEHTVYPVVIDPATVNVNDSADAGVYSKYPSNNYGNEQTGCFGKSTSHGYGRVYEKFEVPSAIKKGAAIHYAYHWVRETTGGTSSTYVRPFLVTSSWSETGITWSNKVGYETETNTNWKNINSASKDKADNPYWYNYNLVNCVKKWISGTANNGVVFVSGEEVDAEQEYIWRAFASRTYSTSAMRPYTVISYTNDTTAPEADVKANTDDWTNSGVTLSISGAADNSDGIGLHSQPYSFSTSSGVYSWSTAASKTFSENTTVYVSVRDALGNIRTYTQKITNIDKTAPVISSVSGNPTEWKNKNAVLTVKGAKDNESGLDSTAYSFSTEPGSFSWQESSSKAFSENTTVYIYVRDKAGNISEPTETVIDRLDGTAPSAPVVTGGSEEWTNDDIELTAQSEDLLSGVAEYSFSIEADSFNWQKENTFTVSDGAKLYVYSRDNAGNISQPAEIDLKIDKLAPTGSASAEESDWVKEVKITANADDTMSGLADRPYSFSMEKGEYIWQSSDTKTAVENGVYYVYVRDRAGNIDLIDTVEIDKIDTEPPEIKNVDTEQNGDILNITVDATDTQSGTAQYSIDNGITWQESNVFAVDKKTVNYYAVRVKDAVGNVSDIGRAEEFSVPQIYFENETLFLYSTGADDSGKMYYKFSAKDKWQEYTCPITVPENADSIYLSFYQKENVTSSDAVPLNFEYSNKLAYTQSKVDMALSYRNVSMNITRQYKNDEWQYSFDSKLSLKNDGALLEIRLTDFNTYSFVKQSKYKYVSEISGRTVTVVYDENDENVVEYILKADKINYHYSSDGLLVKTDNAYGLLYSFSRSENSLVITDGAGRETVIAFAADGVSSITDAKGGAVNYEYRSGNLVKVTDRSGAVIGEYEYTNGVITKSGYTNIYRDSQNRISKLVNDNGYYAKYEYGKNNYYTVTIRTPDEEKTEYSYDFTGSIRGYNDFKGNSASYEEGYYFEEEHRLIKSIYSQTEEETSYSEYLYGYKPIFEFVDGKQDAYYFYDDNGYLVRAVKQDISDNADKKDYAIYYLNDENGNVILQATLDITEFNYELNNIPQEYNVDTEYESVVKYWYENGLVIKTEDVTNQSITVYQYDRYGNVIKTTNEVTKDGETTVSVSENTYDILDRVISAKSGDSETVYTYDAEGRTLLVKADGMYRRTVYDNYGRTVQEIEDADYNPDLDNLPDAYGDTNAGQRYFYDEYGNMYKEINRYGLQTEYYYSDDGLLFIKSFDIYDYYYNNKGGVEHVDVNGYTAVSYEYNVSDKNIQVGSGQSLNRVTYADGYSEKQLVDKSGNVFAKYRNNASQPYYYICDAGGNSVKYNNTEKGVHGTSTIISSKDDELILQSQPNELSNNPNIHYQYYHQTKTDDAVTTSQIDFYGDFWRYETENEDSVTYWADKMPKYTCYYTNDETSSGQTVKKDDLTILNSDITYDEASGSFVKSYSKMNDAEAESLGSYSYVYDANGNITEDENNHYTYDDLGELINVSGEHNSSYIYDNRGNMTSKTVDGVTTTFSYDNTWWDQLVSVNGEALTYDVNGNLTSYGERSFEWSNGKQLSQITEGENTYSYYYDENGIRWKKTVNGTDISINMAAGRVVAQRIDLTPMYFQYDKNGTPFGFIYHDKQYFYITNLSGDVVGITDSNGELIAQYTYDEWGKILSITTAEEGNSEQRDIAELNPLRYRGYYYDNETGYYYLQSRYYDPELGRFISADGFGYINNNNPINVNAYAYCLNNPILYADPSGTEAGWVSDAGRAVAEIISTIFLCWDALERGLKSFGEQAGENFATLIASMVVLDKSILYQSGNTFEERHKKFEIWYQGVFDEFSEFIQSSFYKIVNLIQPDFFFKFFEHVVDTGEAFYNYTLKKIVTFTFGFGDNDLLSSINDYLSGKFKFFTLGSISGGLIWKESSKGAYIEKAFESVGKFFSSISFNIEISDFNFPSLFPEVVPIDNEMLTINVAITLLAILLAAGVILIFPVKA